MLSENLVEKIIFHEIWMMMNDDEGVSEMGPGIQGINYSRYPTGIILGMGSANGRQPIAFF